MARTLVDFTHVATELVVGDLVLDRDALVAAGRDLARHVPDGALVEIPASDPRAVLTGLEAAWCAGATPLPNARAKEIRVLAQHAPLDAALALRTSGSTGVPRMPWFDHDAVARSAARIAGYLDLAADDTVALLQPCDHGFGLIGQLLAAASVGARIVWCGRPFPAERAHAVAHAYASVVAAVPFGLAQLADHLPLVDPLAVDRLRQIGSAGGPLPPDLARRLTIAFPSAVVWNQYGCTEAGPRIAAVPSSHPAFFTGTVGRPIPGVTVWIAGTAGPAHDALPGEIGEICFSSDMAMRGYLDDPVATERQQRHNGLFSGYATGDLGILAEDGRLHVVGRADDIVKIRGERVALDRVARAAEEVGARAALALLSASTESEAAADPTLLLVYEADETIDLARLVRHLPTGVVPRRLMRVDVMPRLPNGKIDRTTLEGIIRGDDP